MNENTPDVAALIVQADAKLANVAKLKWVALNQTEVTDAGLKHLQKLPLTGVHLEGTQVTESAVENLRTATGGRVYTDRNPAP